MRRRKIFTIRGQPNIQYISRRLAKFHASRNSPSWASKFQQGLRHVIRKVLHLRAWCKNDTRESNVIPRWPRRHGTFPHGRGSDAPSDQPDANLNNALHVRLSDMGVCSKEKYEWWKEPINTPSAFYQDSDTFRIIMRPSVPCRTRE